MVTTKVLHCFHGYLQSYVCGRQQAHVWWQTCDQVTRNDNQNRQSVRDSEVLHDRQSH